MYVRHHFSYDFCYWHHQLTSAAAKIEPIGRLGVCALDVKARSKASRNILTRLQASGELDVVIFGDKVILDEGK